jgi:mRNA-degrading endonuclease RelE of RelBE toxin-antitoxin system
MIALEFTKRFLDSSKDLPNSEQRKLASLLERFQHSPFDVSLQTKKLKGALSGLFSFRITRERRVIFQFMNPGTIRLIDVVHRKDAYR